MCSCTPSTLGNVVHELLSVAIKQLMVERLTHATADAVVFFQRILTHIAHNLESRH